MLVKQGYIDIAIAVACGIAFWLVLTLTWWIGVELWAEPADVNPLTGEVVNEQALPTCVAL